MKQERTPSSNSPNRTLATPTRLIQVEELISAQPGLTERQIAEGLFGRHGQQQRVNPLCRRLVAENRIERRGRGYSADPFVYYPKTSPS